MDEPDPITMTVFQNRLEGIAEEMAKVLRKTAYSPNIKERADFSCAIFDADARLVAQAEAIPVHLGSMGFVAKPILEKYGETWREGDAIIVNSPRSEFGGTHLPDVSLLAPVFHNGKLKYIVANRAHHADIGGMVPGSLPPHSTEVYQEGLIIPPIRLFRQGKVNQDVLDLILENVRTPDERRGDLNAQYGALMLGVRRLKELLAEGEFSNVDKLHKRLFEESERGTREKISKFPKGEASFEDFLDSDGISDDPVKICCKVTIRDDNSIAFDFSDSDPQRKGNVNAPFSITTAGIYYVIRLLTGRDVPTNWGCFRPVEIFAPKGCVVNPDFRAATSSANTETSQRIVDVVLGALVQLIPWLPAASQGTMNNVLLGGFSHGKNWTIYETIGGGAGATCEEEGTSGIQCHMTNTENTPIEALEMQFPLVVRRYEIRRGSGGSGEKRGGDGIIREIEFKEETRISLQTERRKLRPWGIFGGGKGLPGKNILIKRGGERINLRGRASAQALSGDRLLIQTPGGGGAGPCPKEN